MTNSTNTSQNLKQIFLLIDAWLNFDTLDHIFLKMTCLGFRTPVIKWFQYYSLNRKFFVSGDHVFSEAAILNCSVPQGFLVYISDLLQTLLGSGSYLYADDRRIFSQDKDVHKIEDVLNSLSKSFVCKKLLICFGEDKKCIPFSKTKHSAKLIIS